jgi:predicted nucleotidyltransferase
VLTTTQLEDLAQLHAVAGQFSADVAIIGAAALLCFVDIGRFTRDIDLVVALDLEAFLTFTAVLKTRGWTQEARKEHRWHGPNGSIVDLLPAGPGLRHAKRITWPESEFEMSLAGFEHVFALAVPVSFAEGVQYRVAPPSVIALLKIIAFMDDPHGRRKDLLDVGELFRRYDASTDRIFSDDVFAAELEEIEYASAFLLGKDVGAIATEEEGVLLSAFFKAQGISDEELGQLDRADKEQREAFRFQQHLRAFRKGIERRDTSKT